MSKKPGKTHEDPCAQCVWRAWAGTGKKVLCALPVCRREEYEQMLEMSSGKHKPARKRSHE
uniref:Uncharacterized protein n=1 Tax=Caudovirales sp. ctu3532 TaxID=2827639 RepID=A0A8S5TI69_9CAUD|nr:MAG TPA: hypothetical protein [Caudovirales sp. ctu3532]